MVRSTIATRLLSIVLALLLQTTPVIAHDSGHEPRGYSPDAPNPDASAVNTKALWQEYVLSAKLVDHNGRSFSLTELGGKPALVNFFYADCVTACSLQLKQLSNVYQTLQSGAARDLFTMVSITINPDVDSPERLERVRSSVSGTDELSSSTSWLFAGGDSAVVERLGKMYGYGKKTLPGSDFDHRTQLYLLDQYGSLIHQYKGIPVDQTRVVNELAYYAQTIAGN